MRVLVSTTEGVSSAEEQSDYTGAESVASALATRLRARTASVAVLGMGYAGLPVAVELARAGFPTTGLDVDEERVRLVNDGRSPVSDVSDAEIAALVGGSHLRASCRFDLLDETDCVLICVPTPLTDGKAQDMRYLEESARMVAAHLHREMLVVLQSTTTPGTTRGVVLPILASRGGLTVGDDYFVAYAPERIDPGNPRYGVRNTPKLVGGITPLCCSLASLLFSPIVSHLVKVSSPEIAEMSKLVENSFRFINISFVNEVAVLCDRMGIDVWEVIDAAATKPFAFMAHYPGPGVGGHCIPVVPFFLESVAERYGMAAELVKVAGRINAEMPDFVVQKLERLLAERGKALSGSRILLLGMAYKADVADCRESPALAVLRSLIRRQVSVAYLDPYVPVVRCDGSVVTSLTYQEIGSCRFDAAVLLTPHSGVDYALVGRQVDFVLDTRNHLRPSRDVTVIKM